MPVKNKDESLQWNVTASCFYSGSQDHPVYVDHIPPAPRNAQKFPIVMVHGGGHTGSCYLATPDGRPGWASVFAAQGYDVFVPDWPGHGRSPMNADFARLGTQEIATSLLALLEHIGPAILMVHSASGPMAWWMTEQRPDLVLAVIGIAPGGPANLLPDLPADPEKILALRNDEQAGCPVYSKEDKPLWFNAAFAADFWANAPRFPKAAFSNYIRSIVPESARVLNERFNIGGKGLKIRDPKNLAQHKILIMTGDHDRRHPRNVDETTANYIGADFLWLPVLGIEGNGHMLMIEDNSDQIAALIMEWLKKSSL